MDKLKCIVKHFDGTKIIYEDDVIPMFTGYNEKLFVPIVAVTYVDHISEAIKFTANKPIAIMNKTELLTECERLGIRGYANATNEAIRTLIIEARGNLERMNQEGA